MAGDFCENREGVHMWSPTLPEFTICGWAFDSPSTEDEYPHGEFKPTTKTTVTCPNCVALIRAVQGVKTRARKDSTHD